MAKVVISKKNPVQFDSLTPFSIVNHETIEGKYYFDIEAKLIVNDPNGALTGNFEIQITRDSPAVNRPNMFKNSNAETRAEFTSLITKYDLDRLKKFDKISAPIKKVTLIYQDFLKSGLTFRIEDQGTQSLYASIVDVSENRNVAIQVINLDFDNLVKEYSLPKENFIVGSARSFKNKTRIVITPLDKRIQKFKVYVQNAPGNQNIPEKKLKAILTPVTSAGFASVDIDDTGSVRKIIKITPTSFYRNNTNSAYKEIVLNDDKKHNEQCVIYPREFTGNSVTFVINNLPDDVIYVDLIRLSKTHNEKNYRTIIGSTSQSSNVSLTDDTITPYTTYSYKASLEFKDGTKHTTAATYVLNPKILETALQINANLASQKTTGNTVTNNFNVFVSYKNVTSTQNLLNDLKALGIDNIFPNEIKNLSAQLDPLIGILATKIDPNTGIEDFIGIFKPGEISITTSSSTYNVFIFEVLIKSPTEIVEDIGSSRSFYTAGAGLTPGNPMIAASALGSNNIDAKMNFTQKFFNKSALTYGLLKYGKTLPTQQSGIESGKTSIFTTLESYPIMTSPKMNFVRTIKRKIDKIIVWKATNVSDVDRFEVIDITNTGVEQKICRAIADISQQEFSTSVDLGVTKIRIDGIMKNNEKVSLEVEI